LVTPPSDQTAVEGASQAFSLGSFVDPDGSPWMVDVNWGDATADTTFGLSMAGSLGTQSHTFRAEGAFTVTVTVTDSTGLSGSAPLKVTVSDPAVVQASAITTPPVEGAAFTGSAFATFTDLGGPEPNAADPSGTLADHYKVDSIDWGDGGGLDTTSGTVTFD